MYLIKGNNIMKKENTIKNKVINYLKEILKFITEKKISNRYVNYKEENSYGKCRTEISMQRLRDRNLF